jgi:hypothetical protein
MIKPFYFVPNIDASTTIVETHEMSVYFAYRTLVTTPTAWHSLPALTQTTLDGFVNAIADASDHSVHVSAILATMGGLHLSAAHTTAKHLIATMLVKEVSTATLIHALSKVV